MKVHFVKNLDDFEQTLGGDEMGLAAFNRARRMKAQQPAEEVPAEKTLQDFTVKELKGIAEEKGIELPKKIKKDDLIQLIEEAGE